MGFFDVLFGNSNGGPTWGGFGGSTSVTPQTIENIKRDWENIEMLLQQRGPSQLRQALITADKALDNALRDVTAGETMGERLKNARNLFDPYVYDNIWKAHKTRNNLVHESGYEPPYFAVTQAVASLKKGLQSLGVNL